MSILTWLVGEDYILEKRREAESERRNMESTIRQTVDDALARRFPNRDIHELRAEHRGAVILIEAKLRGYYTERLRMKVDFLESL